MAIADFDALQNACVATFGIPALWTQAATQEQTTINGIIAKPPLMEEITPFVQDVTNVYFFVRYVDLSPQPIEGDLINLNGSNYFISQVLADQVGGATFRLKAVNNA